MLVGMLETYLKKVNHIKHEEQNVMAQEDARPNPATPRTGIFFRRRVVLGSACEDDDPRDSGSSIER